jgi:predicted transcriptional regulator
MAADDNFQRRARRPQNSDTNRELTPHDQDASIQKLREVFAQDHVAVVRDGTKVVAIVTKIDLIEHLAARV